jgi:hypothetical protein
MEMILKLRKDYNIIIALCRGTIIFKGFNTEIDKEIIALEPKIMSSIIIMTLRINICT